MLPLFVTKSKARSGTTTTATTTTTTTKRAHVAVCPFVHSTNVMTLFLLSKRIAAENRDVQVTMFTDVGPAMYLYWYIDMEEDTNLTIAAVGQWPDYSGGATELDIIKAYLEDYGPNLRESIAKAEEWADGLKITHLVSDALHADVCRGVAEERSIGWSAIWTSSATSLAAYIHADEIRRKLDESFVNVTPGVPVISQQNRSFLSVDKYLPGFPAGVPLHDLPYGILAPEVDSKITKWFQNMSLNLPKAETVIMNSLIDLESSGASALLPKNFEFGALSSLTLPFPPPPRELQNVDDMISFLDRHVTSPGTVIYIHLGTLPLPNEEFEALAEVLEATKFPFLWVIPPTWPRVELPEGFIERTSSSGQGLVVLYRDWGYVMNEYVVTKVLSHKAVGFQLRPGSWISVMQSIVAGVPIVCRPTAKFFDQGLNAALVDNVWGIGVNVEGGVLTKDSASAALSRVRVNRHIKSKIELLKKHAEEDAVEPNGNSAKTLNKFIKLVTK